MLKDVVKHVSLDYCYNYYAEFGNYCKTGTKKFGNSCSQCWCQYDWTVWCLLSILPTRFLKRPVSQQNTIVMRNMYGSPNWSLWRKFEGLCKVVKDVLGTEVRRLSCLFVLCTEHAAWLLVRMPGRITWREDREGPGLKRFKHHIQQEGHGNKSWECHHGGVQKEGWCRQEWQVCGGLGSTPALRDCFPYLSGFSLEEPNTFGNIIHRILKLGLSIDDEADYVDTYMLPPEEVMLMLKEARWKNWLKPIYFSCTIQVSFEVQPCTS